MNESNWSLNFFFVASLEGWCLPRLVSRRRSVILGLDHSAKNCFVEPSERPGHSGFVSDMLQVPISFEVVTLRFLSSDQWRWRFLRKIDFILQLNWLWLNGASSFRFSFSLFIMYDHLNFILVVPDANLIYIDKGLTTVVTRSCFFFCFLISLWSLVILGGALSWP